MRSTYPGELRTGSLKQNGNQIGTKLICWKIGKPELKIRFFETKWGTEWRTDWICCKIEKSEWRPGSFVAKLDNHNLKTYYFNMNTVL